MNPYRIILANSHAPLREGLKRILREKSGLEVIGEAEDGSQLFRLLRWDTFAPHMVILDPSMPRFQGIDAIRTVKALHPQLKILVLSMHRDKEYVSQAIENGAEGYVIKETADKELLPAIEIIMQGKLYLPPFP
jgi:two-component system response regulator NreC